MHQNQVGIAELGGVDGLAGTGRPDFHGVAVGGLKHGQQVTQQAGVIDRGGGGQANDLGFLSSGCNLTGIDGSIVLDIEQVLAVFRNTILASHIQSFLAQQPLNQSIRAGSVHSDVGNGIAVSIGERRLGIHGDGGVGIEHLVVCFLQDAGVHHQSSLSGSFGSRCSRLRKSGSGGGFGSLSLSRLCRAAGDQAQQHDSNQKQRNDLFHVLFLQKIRIKNEPNSNGNRAQ